MNMLETWINTKSVGVSKERSATTSSSLDIKIAKELLALFAKHNLAIMPVYLLTPIFAAIVLIPLNEMKPEMVWWCIGMEIFFVLRLIHHQFVRRALINFEGELPGPVRYLLIYVLVIGAYLSLPFNIYTSPDNLGVSFVVLVYAVVLLAGTMVVTVSYPQVFIRFSLSFTVCASVHLWFLDDQFLRASIILLWVLVAILIIIGQQQHATLLNTVRLSIENESLLKQVNVEKAQAEQANLSKSRFLVATSHDFSQPLNALSLSIDMLDAKSASLILEDAQEIPSPQQIQETLQAQQRIMGHMKASMSALKSLFEDIMDISRIDSESISFQIQPLDLIPLINRLGDEFQPRMQQKDLQLINNLGADPRWVLSDINQLRRILRNLLDNAVKYTEAGTISIDCHSSGQDCVVDISDSGRGIADDELDMIYDEFYQIDNPNRNRSQGIGLGLSIVQRLSRLLDHRVSCTSSLGKGSTFSLRMREALPPISIAADALATGQTLDVSGLSILVIDDEEIICTIMEELLIGWNCQVRTCNSALAALAVLDDFPPDLIISDFWLDKGWTGGQLIDDIRHRVKHKVPAIIVTGTTAKELVSVTSYQEIEAKQPEIKILHKPITAIALMEAIGAAMA